MTTFATDGQIEQINRFGSDAIRKGVREFNLDNLGAQRVIEHGGEFANAIREAALASLRNLSATGKLKSKEVVSDYTYPNGYKVKGITEQCRILYQFLPNIPFRVDEDVKDQTLPQNAEGWFAIPRWEKVASTYNEAVEKVLAMIASKRKFYNYREGVLGPKHLRQCVQTAHAFNLIVDQQKGYDTLIVPAQFGLRYRGRSVRQAREVFQANEFGLGAFAVGIMLLIHPEREIQWRPLLHVDCAGDEYSLDTDVQFFGDAPTFRFRADRVEFYTYSMSSQGGDYGSASGFLQQVES